MAVLRKHTVGSERVDTGEQPDASLVRIALADRTAFAGLYDRYLAPVYGYCARRLASRESAEDATSLVFTRAFSNLSQCDPARFRPWLFTIAHNVVKDMHRAAGASTPVQLSDDVRDPEPTPIEHALRSDAERRVLGLLSRLTSEQRAIVELRIAGLRAVEIADVLGLSPGAVRVAQFRAYSRLRALLASEEVDL